MVYTMDTIRQFAEAKESGAMLEVDEELWEYFLEVLPPIHMGYHANVKNAKGNGTIQVWASFGFAEGWEKVTAFWRGHGLMKGHFYAQLTTEMNPFG